MKQTVFSLMALAIVVLSSCAKREYDVQEPVSGTTHTIQAIIDQGSADVKTTYEEGASTATFSWVSGDRMKLVVYDKDAPFTADKYAYAAQATGANVAFSATSTPDFTEYPKSGYAVYPEDIATGGAKDAFTLLLPAEYTVVGTNFSAVGVPLIGAEVSTDTYVFKPAVGVLKVTLSNVPTSARKLVLTSGSDNLSGIAYLDEIAYLGGITMSEGFDSGIGHSITVNFPQQIAGSTISVYIPVPVGTISAGATLEVQDDGGTPIKTTPATVKPITIAQGHLTPITGAISVEDWTPLGTGKYMDDHGFWGLGDDGRTAGDYANVTIEQNASEPNRYRVSAPYANCTDVATSLPDAADYLYLEVLANESVIYDSYQYGNGAYIMFDSPYWGWDDLYQNSRVINKDVSGNPLNIQLAPYYIDFYTSNCAEKPKIEIVFPGATPMLADVFNYGEDATASYNAGTGKVDVTIGGTTVSAVKVKAAATVNDGVTDLLANNEDLTFAATGSQALALADGNYILVYKVETSGHGYTFKYEPFSVYTKTEIPLTASMISVNVDAGNKDGSAWYDGAGKGALVDGNASTFWHTPYLSASDVAAYYPAITDPYLCSDLDTTYGAYIDIDLGGSKTVTNFDVWAQLRSGASNDFPGIINVYASADGTDWDGVGTTSDAFSGKSAGDWIDPIVNCTPIAPARYIRISIIENSNGYSLIDPSGSACTHLAEIKIYE